MSSLLEHPLLPAVFLRENRQTGIDWTRNCICDIACL
jgi:hypothetical protein